MQVQLLHFLSGPGCFAQKLQAGLYAGFVFETIDIDIIGKALPAIYLHQVLQDHLQGFTVQRVVRLIFHHGDWLSVIRDMTFRVEW